jgi:hypothetical protein
VGAAGAGFGQGTEERRAGVDRVVDQEEAPAAEGLAERLRDAVAHRRGGGGVALGEDEAGAELRRYRLGHEGAARERAADGLRLTGRRPAGELGGPSANAPGVDQQPVEVEPEVAVVAGFDASATGFPRSLESRSAPGYALLVSTSGRETYIYRLAHIDNLPTLLARGGSQRP